MNDMTSVIVPDSSQINADDLQTGPMTVTIAAVKIKGGKEQPVDILLDGMEKVYRPCKSMARILVAAWGADSAKYVGRSLTLYCDPTVKWGGMAVGGLRISHMSDIDSAITMALTVTRANKKPYTVKPIVSELKTAAAQIADTARPASGSTVLPTDQSAPAAATYITAEEALKLEARCSDNSIAINKVKHAFGVERLSAMTGEMLAAAHEMIDNTIEKRKVTA